MWILANKSVVLANQNGNLKVSQNSGTSQIIRFFIGLSIINHPASLGICPLRKAPSKTTTKIKITWGFSSNGLNQGDPKPKSRANGAGKS
jgi:hypothetical protein